MNRVRLLEMTFSVREHSSQEEASIKHVIKAVSSGIFAISCGIAYD